MHGPPGVSTVTRDCGEFGQPGPNSNPVQAPSEDPVQHAGNNEIKHSSGPAGDCETRTRTGDTTIFSRIPVTRAHRFAGDYCRVERPCRVQVFPDFASASGALRPTPGLVGLFAGTVWTHSQTGRLAWATMPLSSAAASCAARHRAVTPASCPRSPSARRGDRLRRCHARRRAGRDQAHVDCPRRRAASGTAAACWSNSRRAHVLATRASRASRRTRSSPRRSRSTAQPAGSTCLRSTMSRSPTAGSRRRWPKLS